MPSELICRGFLICTLKHWSATAGKRTTSPPLLLYRCRIGDGEDLVGDLGKVGGVRSGCGFVICGMVTGKRSSEIPLSGD